jgi:hypothetical protein
MKALDGKPVLTVLTVLVVLLILITGAIEVVTGSLTYEEFLTEVLKFVGAALALGTGIGRGLDALGRHLAGNRVSPGERSVREVPLSQVSAVPSRGENLR